MVGRRAGVAAVVRHTATLGARERDVCAMGLFFWAHARYVAEAPTFAANFASILEHVREMGGIIDT